MRQSVSVHDREKEQNFRIVRARGLQAIRIYHIILY